MLRVLDQNEKEQAQNTGYMCEHLLCLYSMVSDRVAIWNEEFPVFLSDFGEADVVLFGLKKKNEDRIGCIKELMELPIDTLNLISPIDFGHLPNFRTKYVDWDFHVNVEQFDLEMKGRNYKNIRYRVNQAKKMGYSSELRKTWTRKHTYILSRHIASHKLDIWDYEELLSLEAFFREHDHAYLMDAYLENRLVGFDVVDFFENSRIMVIPLGIYLNKPLISDFLMYENLKFARKNKYYWLDVGPTCGSEGLKDFKKKWFAEPKYTLYVQSLNKIGGRYSVLPSDLK